MKVVMGIDPGTANLGFGVIRIEGGHMVALDGGVIETSSSTPIEERLAHIHSSLAELLRWHRPSALAIEDLFFGKNIGSAISVHSSSSLFCAAIWPPSDKNGSMVKTSPLAIRRRSDR